MNGLNDLFAEWAKGATILAGTAVPVADPIPAGPRISRKCRQCTTWCVGGSETEAADRLAEHQRRRHG